MPQVALTPSHLGHSPSFTLPPRLHVLRLGHWLGRTDHRCGLRRDGMVPGPSWLDLPSSTSLFKTMKHQTRGPNQAMKNNGFHVQKPCFLQGKHLVFDGPCAALGSQWQRCPSAVVPGALGRPSRVRATREAWWPR